MSTIRPWMTDGEIEKCIHRPTARHPLIEHNLPRLDKHGLRRRKIRLVIFLGYLLLYHCLSISI